MNDIRLEKNGKLLIKTRPSYFSCRTNFPPFKDIETMVLSYLGRANELHTLMFLELSIPLPCLENDSTEIEEAHVNDSR